MQFMRLAALTCLLPGVIVAVAAAAQSTIVGTVTDRTTGRPSAGDTVALIAFGNGMQVAAETKTDKRGHYTLPVAAPGVHLVRVDHEKATYFQPAPEGAHTVDVDVYDVAAKVPGIVTEADVLSMETAPSGELQVNEDFFVRNDSKPPRTQFSEHAYEFYLPAGAKLEGSAAMGPAGMPVSSTPVPAGGNGLYAFVFPVRPGENRFRVSYSLPYNGQSMQWAPHEAMPTENLVVLLPKSMQFTPSGGDWQPVPANPDAQTYVLKNVRADTGANFSIGGTGSLPREAQNGGNDTQSPESQGSEVNSRPGGGLGPPIDTPDPLHRYKGWMLGGLGMLLILAAAWLMRRPSGAPAAAARKLPPALEPTPEFAPEPQAPRFAADPPLRAALEQALLSLERERALGRIPEAEYVATRPALTGALERALQREAESQAPAASR